MYSVLSALLSRQENGSTNPTAGTSGARHHPAGLASHTLASLQCAAWPAFIDIETEVLWGETRTDMEVTHAWRAF